MALPLVPGLIQKIIQNTRLFNFHDVQFFFVGLDKVTRWLLCVVTHRCGLSERCKNQSRLSSSELFCLLDNYMKIAARHRQKPYTVVSNITRQPRIIFTT